MKRILTVIAFLAMVTAVVPQVQAQTRQQQQELEQIAQRSVNGLSAQDRTRVVQIMTDIYVAQGMSRSQAASLAEMAADTMFSDATNQPPTQQQQGSTGTGGQIHHPVFADATQGWPDASVFRNEGIPFTLTLPTVNTPNGYTSSYDTNGGRFMIYMGRNYNTSSPINSIPWTDAEFTQVRNELSRQTGITLTWNAREQSYSGERSTTQNSYNGLEVRRSGEYIEIRCFVRSTGSVGGR